MARKKAKKRAFPKTLSVVRYGWDLDELKEYRPLIDKDNGTEVATYKLEKIRKVKVVRTLE